MKRKPSAPSSRPLKSRPIPLSFFAPRDDTLILWLGMAGVLINTRGTILFIDPLLTAIRRVPGILKAETGHTLNFDWPIRARNIPRADALLYTHADGDHFGMATAQTIATRTRAPIIAPRLVLRWLEEMALDNTLLEARAKSTIHIGNANILITPALHDYPTDFPFKLRDCVGYLIRTPDGDIWHPGDTRLIPELRAYRCDIMFFDIAAVDFHLGPQGSATLAKTSGAKLLIPYHYATFDMPRGSWGGCLLKDALPTVKGLQAQLLSISPGQPIRLSRGQIKIER